MTELSEYGPDKPCRRTVCIEREPAPLPAPQGKTAAHLGGAHLDPRDRAHYDGPSILVSALPYQVRDAVVPLLAEVGSYDREAEDTPLRASVELAIATAGREIEFLRQQIAHVRVDADHKVLRALQQGESCEHHGQQITELKDQLDGAIEATRRAEAGRLALVGMLHRLREFTEGVRSQASLIGTMPTSEEIIAALEKATTKASAAHDRAWRR